MLIPDLPYNKFSIGVDGPIFLYASNFLQELCVGMRANLIFLKCSCCLVHISIEVFILRDGMRIVGFLVHVDTVEVHILDVFFFAASEFSLALALNAIMVVILIGSFHMFVACDFFAGDAMRKGIGVGSVVGGVVSVVEL